MHIPVNLVLQKRLRRCSFILATIVVIVAIAVLIGWEKQEQTLKSIWPDSVSMNPLTAICFILSAFSFIGIVKSRENKKWQTLSALIAALIILVALIKVINGAIAADINIDQFIYPGLIEKEKIPNRMAYNTALGMALTGIILLLLPSAKRKKLLLSQFLAVGLFLLGLMVLLGYIYQAEAFYGFFAFTPMAVNTGFLFFLLGLAFLFYSADRGIMLLFTSGLSGSTMARILAPAAIIIPALFGMLRLWGYWDGVYDNEFGVVLHVVIIIMLFLLLVGYNASVLNKRDLSNRQTQESLLSSEAQIRSIFDNAPDAVIVINDKGVVEKWNPQATALFGWTNDEVSGQSLSSLIIPEELRESHRKGMERYLETRKSGLFSKTVDLWAIRKDKTKLDVSLRISPLQVNGKQLFIGFIRDITEQKQMEDRLKSFNQELGHQVERKTSELTEIFERVTDGFIAMDKRFHFTYVNKKAGQLLRREPAVLIGKDAEKEFPEIINSVMHQAILKAMKQQVHVNVTDYHAQLDLWQESNIYPSENGLSIFIKDITVQRRKEQEVAEARGIADKLIDSLPGVFYFYDEHGRFIKWNKQLEEVTGYSTEEIAAMHPVQLFPDDEKEYISARIATVFEKGENDAEASFLSKSGKRTPYYFKAVLLDYHGGPCLLGSGIDITEIKAAEEELKDSYESIRQLTGYLQNIREKERLHMSREIHDELGQLLTVMKMDIAWLNKKLADSSPSIQNKMTDLLSVIDKTVTTVRRIASELRPSLLDNLGLVAAIEWHLEEFKKRSGLDVITALPSQELSLPDSQKIALFRVLQESLTNVGRHAEADRVKVSLNLTHRILLLQIEDNGKGFDANLGNRKTLGLLGMRERISDIGGDYQIESEPGKGTMVTVTLSVKEQNV